jgi:parallel beta-helix repeat protein
MNRLTKLLALAVALAVPVSAAVVTTAVAKHHHHSTHKKKHHRPRPTKIHCGMVITKSIKVANDLTCDLPSHPGMPPAGTPPFGLFVPPGTHKITIDLNGHSLSGPRLPGQSGDVAVGHSVEMIGIQLMRANHVTVRNGTIRRFDAGISDSHGNHNNLFKLNVVDNQNYEVVNGAIDYLPPSPTLKSVTATGTVGTSVTYAYEVVTAQAPNPANTPGDNGTGGKSYEQDSLATSPKTVTNDATLAAGVNSNTITFTGVGSSFATGYRVLRSVNGGPFIWIGTVASSASTTTYTFVDQGQSPPSTAAYHAVSLQNHNVSVNDTCDNGDGIVIDASSFDTVSNNVAVDNGPFSGIALVGEYNGKTYDGPQYNTIRGNTVSHNAILNVDPGYNNPNNSGMSAYCGTGPGGGGMTRGREVQDGGIRIEGPAADHNTVSGNHVSGAGFNGIAIHSWICHTDGPQPNGAPNSYNTVIGNSVWDTGRYTPGALETNLDGIGFLASGPPNVVCVSGNNKIMNNNSFHNFRDGIYLGGRANSGNTVSGNTVTGNASNGIEAAAGGPGYGQPPNALGQNKGSGNGKFDGFDGNANCAGNTWSSDTFAKVNVTCVK